MLSEGRIPLNPAEHEAVEQLLAAHVGNATLTRRDAGETGPLLVHIGDETYLVDAEGRAEAAG